MQVEDGKVKVKPQPDISNLLVYKGMLFGDADYCLTVRMPNARATTTTRWPARSSGPKDYDNYYMFMITPSGFAEITRKVNGKWIDVIDWQHDADIKRDAGSNNVLRVRDQRRHDHDLYQRSEVRDREGPDARRRRPDRHAGPVRERTRSTPGSSAP